MLDFGEQRYPMYFPGHEPTLSFDPYLYRFYPATGIYLGVAGASVYVMGGPFGSAPLQVGVVTDFIGTGSQPPVLTREPASARVVAPAVATFEAAVGGSTQPAWQWQLSEDGGVSFVDIEGATAASYTTPATTLDHSGRQFRVRATNAGAGVVSARATLTVASGGAVAALVDTGIDPTQCFAAGSEVPVACSNPAALALSDAQDGMVGLDITEPNGADGRLGFSWRAIPGGCVKDNRTGLTWEVKTASIGGVRDQYKTFTNFGDGREGDASAYVTAVNALRLCGYDDWRIPTLDELQSLWDYGRSQPDVAWFPTMLGAITSEPVAGDPASDWTFGAGEFRKSLRSFPKPVQLVR